MSDDWERYLDAHIEATPREYRLVADPLVQVMAVEDDWGGFLVYIAPGRSVHREREAFLAQFEEVA